MGFPYLVNINYERGDFTQFASTALGATDQMAVRHYSDLVARNVGEVPYRGAYCQHVDLSKGTADCYAEATVAGAATSYLSCMVYVSADLRMTVGDRLTVLSLRAGASEVATVSVTNNAGRLQWLAGQTATTTGAPTRSADLGALGRWHMVQLVADATSLSVYIDGSLMGTPVTGLTLGAITNARVGAWNIDPGTTQGHILFDQLLADDGTLGWGGERYPQVMTVESSGVVLAGNGAFESYNLSLVGTPVGDETVTVYDSDSNEPVELCQMLGPVITSEATNRRFKVSKRDGYFQRGLRVVMAGTNPRCVVVLRQGLTSAGMQAEWARRRPGPRLVG